MCKYFITKEFFTSHTYLTCLPLFFDFGNTVLFYSAVSINNIIIIMSTIIKTASIFTCCIWGVLLCEDENLGMRLP